MTADLVEDRHVVAALREAVEAGVAAADIDAALRSAATAPEGLGELAPIMLAGRLFGLAYTARARDAVDEVV